MASVLNVNIIKEVPRADGLIKARAIVLLEANDLTQHEVDTGLMFLGGLNPDVTVEAGNKALRKMRGQEKREFIRQLKNGIDPFIANPPIWHVIPTIKRQLIRDMLRTPDLRDPILFFGYILPDSMTDNALKNLMSITQGKVNKLRARITRIKNIEPDFDSDEVVEL